MLERLADIIYWGCTAGAVLWAAFSLYAITTQARPEWGMGIIVAGIVAVPLWLAGRAVRYVLAGK